MISTNLRMLCSSERLEYSFEVMIKVPIHSLTKEDDNLLSKFLRWAISVSRFKYVEITFNHRLSLISYLINILNESFLMLKFDKWNIKGFNNTQLWNWCIFFVCLILEYASFIWSVYYTVRKANTDQNPYLHNRNR